ncbi:MAG TPA: MYXO-CTERM sorting domain-containing protein [Nannocystaceae bacterium]|nr:MYXO-CTERM sorting domain-containing protein [Nannocystaceae bacterium]
MHAARRSLEIGLAAAATALVIGSPVARAGNGIHPRTPVVFPDPPCMTVHDRSIDPVLSFAYTIPYEDTDKTMDEVPDSRRHQFIAFCRDHHPQDPLLNWISEADVAAAAATDPPLVDPMTVPPAEIFETSAAWKDCWTRIIPDDQRREITFAEAMKPVLWDTTGLPVGPYVIEGYTWEPPYNMWTPRPGVVKIIDGDPDAAPPALAVTNLDEIIWSDESVAINGCYDAVDGSTLTAYWSLTDFDKLAWKVFAEDVPVDGDAFMVDFAPPPEAVGESVMIRIDITDPMDRTSTAYMTYLITVLDGVSGSTSDTCGPFDPGCTTGGTASTGDTSTGTAGSSSTTDATGTSAASASASGTSTAGADDGGNEGNCACRADASPSSGLALVGLVVALRRRPRRR